MWLCLGELRLVFEEHVIVRRQTRARRENVGEHALLLGQTVHDGAAGRHLGIGECGCVCLYGVSGFLLPS